MAGNQFFLMSNYRVGRRRALEVAIGGALLSVLPGRVAAQSEIRTSSSGNGGVATASADGGALAIGDINSGGNAGNAIAVGDTAGSVAADGREIVNSTTIVSTADGGTAIADAAPDGGSQT